MRLQSFHLADFTSFSVCDRKPFCRIEPGAENVHRGLDSRCMSYEILSQSPLRTGLRRAQRGSSSLLSVARADTAVKLITIFQSKGANLTRRHCGILTEAHRIEHFSVAMMVSGVPNAADSLTRQSRPNSQLGTKVSPTLVRSFAAGLSSGLPGVEPRNHHESL